MENLIESNERTLIMFDSVCSGLSSCLALVHADIKQMTEHRNKLAQLEHEQIQAKLISAQELTKRTSDDNDDQETKDAKHKHQQDELDGLDGADPHHLSKLKLLDKRLADTFSHALSMNDLQKSSIHAKQQASQNRPSIFQVFLRKSSKVSSSQKRDNANSQQQVHNDGSSCQAPDNKTIIDDINRQTRLAMQYSKQLEAHLLKVEDLRSKYEMHLKMGLVVKSVAKVYLNNAATVYGASSGHNSPNSLARRHHCSSLVINDNSSMGTHSSMSSLNLSTWSSASRSKAKNKPQEAANNYTNQNNNNNMYVSTISLNQKNQRRLSLAKLISSAKNYHDDTYICNQQQQQQRHHHDELMMAVNGLSPRISSHSNELSSSPSSPLHYSAAQMDRAEMMAMIAENGKYCDNAAYGDIGGICNLSKSNANLHASQTSLKRSGRGRSKSQSGGNKSGSSKTTIKEFIENIDKIEAEFETYMGSFLLTIEDIQGFARVCQGDVFEITIKYGESQKFKTKISVLKDNKQKCVNRQAVFKARIADVLAIKAHECKGLGKRVLLGHKLCETRDLFTARSQLMTTSLNQTGSIKLNLIVTWNPLHLAPNSTASVPGLDISHFALPSTPVSSSTLSSTSSSVPSMNGTMTSTINIQSKKPSQQQRNGTSYRGGDIDEDSRNTHPVNQKHESIYQAVDPIYGYYIPPPDYLTNDVNY